MSDYMSPGRRIRHYRMQRGMTQKTLGIAAGFSPETADIRIAQYESGARMPKHDLLCTLAEALGVSPSALDIPRIKSREVLNQLLLALEEEYALKVTITENNGRSKTDENLYDHKNQIDDQQGQHNDYHEKFYRLCHLCAYPDIYHYC